MKAIFRKLAAASLVSVAGPCGADEASDFFDMIEPDAPATKEAPVRPKKEDALDGLPENIRMMLDRLEQFSEATRAKMQAEIAGARKIAAEILVKNAAKTDAIARAALLEEAKRVETLEPDTPLVDVKAATASESPTLRKLVGGWIRSDNGNQTDFHADGRMTIKGKSAPNSKATPLTGRYGSGSRKCNCSAAARNMSG